VCVGEPMGRERNIYLCACVLVVGWLVLLVWSVFLPAIVEGTGDGGKTVLEGQGTFVRSLSVSLSGRFPFLVLRDGDAMTAGDSFFVHKMGLLLLTVMTSI
jgi:hypothetical protein